MPSLVDLTGKRFGRLEVIQRKANKGREPTWECVCDCGNRKTVLGRNLRTGSTKSCGCYNREKAKTHGQSGTKLYVTWKSITNRCNGFTESTRELYKDKGIIVCERWNDFDNFLEDMQESFEEHVALHGISNTTIDRIDGDKGYCPDNCRWATYTVQARNRKFRNENPGVVRKKGKWKANIGVDGVQIHLGTFAEYDDAVKARKQAEEKYWRNA